eukprot:6491763-Amphidinium_carterae.3
MRKVRARGGSHRKLAGGELSLKEHECYRAVIGGVEVAAAFLGNGDDSGATVRVRDMVSGENGVEVGGEQGEGDVGSVIPEKRCE